LTEEKASGRTADSTGKIRGIPDNPVGKHGFDLLPVGLCLLLVWKVWNSFLENCCNHKNLQRPSKLKLDSDTGGWYAFSSDGESG
jgi:hypothetical protein